MASKDVMSQGSKDGRESLEAFARWLGCILSDRSWGCSYGKGGAD